MADVISTKTQLAVTIEDVVSEMVQAVLTAKMVVPPTIMDFSSMVGPGMDTLKIPRFGNFVVGDKVAGTPVDSQANAFSSDDLDLDKHKTVQVFVEDIASLQSKVMAVELYLEQAGKDLAAEIDASLLTSMAASPSAAAPDHIIDFANSPTDTVTRGDFLAARKLLNVQSVPLEDRFVIISPLRESEILGIDSFVHVDNIGSDQAVRNGQIGKLYGFDVIMSSQASDNATLFYHKSTEAFARQLAPRVQNQYELAYLATRYSVDHIYGVKALAQGKRIVKLNTTGA